MAISAKMMAVLQKVDAAREAYFDGLRESAKQDAARARTAKAMKTQAARRRAAQARSVSKKPKTT